MLTRMRYEHVPIEGPNLSRYLQALAPTRMAGATKVVRLQALDVADPTTWFRTSSFTDAFDTFRGLLCSEAALRALPEVLEGASFPAGEPPCFSAVPAGALLLDGELARLLTLGGAYVRYAGTDRAAKSLAVEAARDLLQDRYEDFDVYHSAEAWSPWFCDVAWDSTLLLVDHATVQVTLMVTTDTD